jgi:hypothetical protein
MSSNRIKSYGKIFSGGGGVNLTKHFFKKSLVKYTAKYKNYMFSYVIFAEFFKFPIKIYF